MESADRRDPRPAPSGAAPRPCCPGVRHLRLFLAVAGPILVLDIATKHFVFNSLGAAVGGGELTATGRVAGIIPGILDIQCVLNKGAFSGWFAGAPWLLTAISAGAIAVITAVILRSARLTRVVILCCALLWAGTAGNLHDRLRFGGVRDFIRVTIPKVFEPWPNFNVADSAICIGVGLLLLHEFRRKEGDREKTSR